MTPLAGFASLQASESCFSPTWAAEATSRAASPFAMVFSLKDSLLLPADESPALTIYKRFSLLSAWRHASRKPAGVQDFLFYRQLAGSCCRGGHRLDRPMAFRILVSRIRACLPRQDGLHSPSFAETRRPPPSHYLYFTDSITRYRQTYTNMLSPPQIVCVEDVRLSGGLWASLIDFLAVVTCGAGLGAKFMKAWNREGYQQRRGSENW